MSEWSYVGAAYGLTWAVLTGYVLYLRSRIRRARHVLEQTLEASEVER
ncbi:MAG TPA: CcmD family protein [Longimicrobiales bacterium]